MKGEPLSRLNDNQCSTDDYYSSFEEGKRGPHTTLSIKLWLMVGCAFALAVALATIHETRGLDKDPLPVSSIKLGS